MLQGFCGAERLSYSEDVRECVRDHGSLSLHTLVGCPPVIFFKISQVLEAGKAYITGDLPLEKFEKLLDGTERFLRGWDPEQAVYPTAHREWRQLAEAYRHACLLRIMRFPDTFAIQCDDSRIKTSVAAILDICAAMPRDSVFYKRLIFPLFLAGADTSSPHQMHYVSLCIDDIKKSTGFRHTAMTEVLSKVWEERRTNSHSQSNVPWMEFVSPPNYFMVIITNTNQFADLFRVFAIATCLLILLTGRCSGVSGILSESESEMLAYKSYPIRLGLGCCVKAWQLDDLIKASRRLFSFSVIDHTAFGLIFSLASCPIS